MRPLYYELMGQIQKPDENIIEFFLENCDNVIWGKYLINNVALSRKQYVGILMENGMLERWYSEKDKKSQVFKLLVSISPKLGNNEIEFIIGIVQIINCLLERTTLEFPLKNCFADNLIENLKALPKGERLDDPIKEQILKEMFEDSTIYFIYGAAGTGKTTLINHVKNLLLGRQRLYLAKTNPAVDNLRRKIGNEDGRGSRSVEKRLNLKD